MRRGGPCAGSHRPCGRRCSCSSVCGGRRARHGRSRHCWTGRDCRCGRGSSCCGSRCRFWAHRRRAPRRICRSCRSRGGCCSCACRSGSGCCRRTRRSSGHGGPRSRRRRYRWPRSRRRDRGRTRRSHRSGRCLNHELSSPRAPSRPRETRGTRVLYQEKARVFVSWATTCRKGFRDEVRRRRETPAGRFVLRLYKEERHI